MFSTLGAAPVLGRLPVDDDPEMTVVISDALWADWFGRDPGVIGRTVEVFGTQRPIIGVMGKRFHFPDDGTLLWITAPLLASDIDQPGQFGGNLVARMAPGATIASVTDELNTLASQLPERFGGSAAYASLMKQHRAVVRPLEQQLLGRFARSLWVMLAAAGIVLAIACANVINLFMVRAEGRHREMAVRRALGAGRGRLLRLQMAESMLIALLAGALAVLIDLLALPVLLRAAPSGLPRLDQVSLDGGALAFTLATTLLVGLLCGLLPALRASAPSLAGLRDGGRAVAGRRHRVSHALVAGQTALALVLLIGSGLLLRSVVALLQVDPGYDSRDVFTFQIAPERPSLDDPASYARFHLQFLQRLAALPSVQSVGLVENVPIDEGTATVRVRTEDMAQAAEEGALLNFTYTAGDYFQTMGIGLRGGRLLTDQDHSSALGNVLVSRSAAERLWPQRDALGQRLQREGQTVWETVVGVVDDVLQDGVDGKPEAVIYLPLVGPVAALSRPISSPAYVLKSVRADSIAADVRALVREVAPEAPMYREYTMTSLVARSMAQYSFSLLMLGITSGLALVLGGIGLYGVLSYVVAERAREIGVRMALGARAGHVRRMVVMQGVSIVAVGMVIGLIGAVAMTRALDTLLFGVKALDGATFVAMSAAMLAIGLLASYLPARRASSLDPIHSLRRE